VAGRALDTSTLTRALYSSDASLQRVPPAAVARPASVDDLTGLVEDALASGRPITPRGAGTSIAGNAIGPGTVIDCRDLNRIVRLDPVGRTAVVEPGVVAVRLTAAASVHGLRFGPDPATVDRCTIGGMIGNNACGARALGYGRTADNVVGLDVITGSGERLSLGPGTTPDASPTLRALHDLVRANLGTIRTEFGRFSRQVSGYSLEHLLPEHGFDVARFLAGSEGTLAVVTGATLRLAEAPEHTVLVVAGFPDMASAADAMPAVLAFGPTAAEGIDRRLLDLPDLPPGDSWVIVELAGGDRAELAVRAAEVARAIGGLGSVAIFDPVRVAALWQARADAAGRAAVSLDRPAYGGWEDAAVPPTALGAYLRDFEALLAAHGLHGLPYGHFGEGCVHVRIDVDLSCASGVAGYRRFVEEAADLVAGYGGSLSGEHGDGRARSELLPRMYSSAAIALFAAVKHVFDPDNLLNPGVLVDPRPLDADLRRPLPAFGAERCTGVGKCLTHSDTMCPSYQATGREVDSTRGRARVLQEMADGRLVTGGWAAPEVAEALEFCLSCKACATECPTGTDIATAKSKLLAERYRGRLRPRSHYSLGWLPTWARLVTAVPGLPAAMNAVAATGFAKRLAGIDLRRTVPRFVPRRRPPASRDGRPVVVWVDSFTANLDSGRLATVFEVLSQAGFAPRVLERTACCGLPWITTGQRDHAARLLRQAIEVLHPVVATGTPVLGLEPSCLAVWRSDAADLVDDPRLPEVRDGLHTLAGLLATTDWTPPDLTGLTVVAQPHCHHASVLGWDTDAALLARTGATVTTVTGCCGLAGNFGVEQGHYEVSLAVANTHLLPAIEAAGPDAVILADGFSCRYQVADLLGRPSLTLAQLLASVR
jgi:FAD/FMN-containing dehydrogenase/Fe-S oxidoreductase